MIAIYSRVSTQEQAREGYSIGEQVERLKAFCKAKNWRAVKEYTDAGFSGGNINRPALQELIMDVKSGLIERVVVFKLDRLSRSQKDTLELIEDVFLSNGCDFVSMNENFDTSSPFGKAMIGILAVFAQLEREQIKERVTIGREARTKDGKWHGGGVPPIGYDYVNGELVINDYEAMQIREAYKLYLSGYNYTEIADLLNKKGYSHKYGKWSLNRLRFLLPNNIYIGYVKFAGESYKGIHEPLIDEETFHKTVALINKNTYRKKPSSPKTLLTGKLYCEKCGKRYRSNTSLNRDGSILPYYRLPEHQSFRADKFESIIFDEMRKLTLDDVRAHRSERPDVSKSLKKELVKIEKQRSRLLDLYSFGDFSADELSAKINPLNERKIALMNQISAESDVRPIEELDETIQSISDVLDSKDMIAIRALIEELIDRIDVNGEDITIYWNFD
jgi:site-specific DNA recombinase